MSTVHKAVNHSEVSFQIPSTLSAKCASAIHAVHDSKHGLKSKRTTGVKSNNGLIISQKIINRELSARTYRGKARASVD